jgi:hypothetical protein
LPRRGSIHILPPILRASFIVFGVLRHLEPSARLFLEFTLGSVATHKPSSNGTIASMHKTLFGSGHLYLSGMQLAEKEMVAAGRH